MEVVDGKFARAELNLSSPIVSMITSLLLTSLLVDKEIYSETNEGSIIPPNAQINKLVINAIIT